MQIEKKMKYKKLNLSKRFSNKSLENKKFLILLLLGIIASFTIFSVHLISAQETGSVSYCAERTLDGAWCQNVPLNEVDQSFRSAPTSCESTSFCRLGTCVDSTEGSCMENTPERVCQDNGGVWHDEEPEEILQCGLGCCFVGDQAAFVTQTRCKRLASLYGVETDFRSDIQNEVQCIASATSDVKGACVFTEADSFDKTCLFITKRECQGLGASGIPGNGTNSRTDVEFHEGFLCSAESLGTICGPTQETTCIEGEDGVHFVDSCGNPANIYDASKVDDKNYWSKIVDKADSCNPGSSNADSATCGSCDYFLGSTCKEFQRGEDRTRPNFGDNICRDLSCNFNGERYEHGETFCANAEGIEDSLPGSRHFRQVCYNGEITTEACADFRQEVCIESSVDGFSVAACRVNRWQDCTSQSTQQDCENTDRRDCRWRTDDVNEIRCVPLNAPGFDFYNPGGDAEVLCSQANTECIVTFEKGLIGNEKCVDNCECLSTQWEESQNQMCVALGDCGVSINYIGVQGYNHGSTIVIQDVDDGE